MTNIPGPDLYKEIDSLSAFSYAMIEQGLGALLSKSSYHPYLTSGKDGQKNLTDINRGPYFSQFKDDEHALLCEFLARWIPYFTSWGPKEIDERASTLKGLIDLGVGDGVTLQLFIAALQEHGITIENTITLVDTNEQSVLDAKDRLGKIVGNTIRTIHDTFANKFVGKPEERILITTTGCTIGNQSEETLREARKNLKPIERKEAFWIQTYYLWPEDPAHQEEIKRFTYRAYGAKKGATDKKKYDKNSPEYEEYRNHKKQVTYYLRCLGRSDQDLSHVRYSVQDYFKENGNWCITPGFTLDRDVIINYEGIEYQYKKGDFFPLFVSERYTEKNIRALNVKISGGRDSVRYIRKGKYTCVAIVGVNKILEKNLFAWTSTSLTVTSLFSFASMGQKEVTATSMLEAIYALAMVLGGPILGVYTGLWLKTKTTK